MPTKPRQQRYLATVLDTGTLDFAPSPQDCMRRGLLAYKGMNVEITVRPYNPHSRNQQGYFFGPVCEHFHHLLLEKSGMAYDTEMVANFLVSKSLGRNVEVVNQYGEVEITRVAPLKRTLTKEDYTHLLEFCRAYSIEFFGVDIPDPTEYRLTKNFVNL